MPFQKGHRPYNKKSPQTESLQAPQPPEQTAAGLLHGVTLPKMGLGGYPGAAEAVSTPTKKATPTARASALSSDGIDSILPLLVRALEKIAEGQEDSREAAVFALEQARKAQQPLGAKFSPNISIYNPQGEREYPKPKLKCKMFLPWEADRDSMTFEEVELLNLLEEGEYRVKRNDGTHMTMTVKIQTNLNNGKPEWLLMNSETGFSNLKHRQVRELRYVLRDILDQRLHTKMAAAKVLTMEQRAQMVESGELPISQAQF